MPIDNRAPTPKSMTRPHKRLHSLLAVMGFIVEDEVRVGKYSLDCYVRELHMGFEADGKRVHAGVHKQAKDKARDEWIWENAGIPIMRIQHDALQFQLWDDGPNGPGLKSLIMDFIDRFEKDIEERRSKATPLAL